MKKKLLQKELRRRAEELKQKRQEIVMKRLENGTIPGIAFTYTYTVLDAEVKLQRKELIAPL